MTPLSQAVGRLDESSNLPLYQQLQRALRQAIETRILSPNDALPPERDLAHEFSVSRITVRKAIDGLVSEDMLVRRQGSGTFVCSHIENGLGSKSSPGGFVPLGHCSGARLSHRSLTSLRAS